MFIGNPSSRQHIEIGFDFLDSEYGRELGPNFLCVFLHLARHAWRSDSGPLGEYYKKDLIVAAINQQDLANRVGLSRRYVQNILTKMLDEGWIHKTKKTDKGMIYTLALRAKTDSGIRVGEAWVCEEAISRNVSVKTPKIEEECAADGEGGLRTTCAGVAHTERNALFYIEDIEKNQTTSGDDDSASPRREPRRTSSASSHNPSCEEKKLKDCQKDMKEEVTPQKDKNDTPGRKEDGFVFCEETEPTTIAAKPDEKTKPTAEWNAPDFVKFFAFHYEKKFNRRAAITWGKDGQLVKQLLAVAKSKTELRNVILWTIKEWDELSSSWKLNGAPSFGLIRSCWDSLVATKENGFKVKGAAPAAVAASSWDTSSKKWNEWNG